jgi:hypothetical protein
MTLHDYAEHLAEQNLRLTDVAMRAVFEALAKEHKPKAPLPERSRGDDDYSGVSLPEVGSIRESEERNV